MKISLLQMLPSKKNSRASHGVGAGVMGLSVGSGLGDNVLQMSMKLQLPFMKDPEPNTALQQIMRELYDGVPAMKNWSFVQALPSK